MQTEILIKWIGTAGFHFKVAGSQFVTDPFLSRLDPENPHNLDPSEFQNVQHIFIGHGHFDHVWDVPAICQQLSTIQVYGSRSILQKLKKRNVLQSQLFLAENLNGTTIGNFKVHSFKSEHVHFDCKLIKDTWRRAGWKGFFRFIRDKGFTFPEGEVRSYLFEYNGYKILFLSSAGASAKETAFYRNMGVDLLLLPVQGNSNILQIAARIGAEIQPHLIIPHHHDNFYSPISQKIDVSKLPEMLGIAGYKGKFLELEMFQETEL